MNEEKFINQVEPNANDFIDELSDEALDRSQARACCGFPCVSCQTCQVPH